MSKPIYMTQEIRQALVSRIAEDREHFFNGVSVQYSMHDDARATLVYTERAWVQMKFLVYQSDKEIAWHGVVERENENTFIVKELLVYPQTVTSASVDMDIEKYSQWIIDNVGDERFDNIRLQGHSHVNMDTTPSGVDEKHQKDIFKQIPEDSFYIFVIANKKGSMYNKIFDFKNNKIYDKDEVDVLIDYEDNGILNWLDASKDMIQEYVAPAVPKTPKTVAQAVVDDAGKTKGKIGMGWAGPKKEKAKGYDQYMYGFTDDLDELADYYSKYGYGGYSGYSGRPY